MSRWRTPGRAGRTTRAPEPFGRRGPRGRPGPRRTQVVSKRRVSSMLVRKLQAAPPRCGSALLYGCHGVVARDAAEVASAQVSALCGRWWRRACRLGLGRRCGEAGGPRCSRREHTDGEDHGPRNQPCESRLEDAPAPSHAVHATAATCGPSTMSLTFPLATGERRPSRRAYGSVSSSPWSSVATRARRTFRSTGFSMKSAIGSHSWSMSRCPNPNGNR